MPANPFCSSKSKSLHASLNPLYECTHRGVRPFSPLSKADSSIETNSEVRTDLELRRLIKIKNCELGSSHNSYGLSFRTSAKISDFLTPPVRKFTQPPLLRLLTMSAFGGTTPPHSVRTSSMEAPLGWGAYVISVNLYSLLPRLTTESN